MVDSNGRTFEIETKERLPGQRRSSLPAAHTLESLRGAESSRLQSGRATILDELGVSSRSRIGLLLGAGGIRGCAHAGVFTVLEESNIVADVVVGASIGALFGSAYAAGWDADRISRLTDVAPRRAVAEFYLNRLRIDRSTYIGSLMLQLGADTQIEDLPRAFACMALDQSTGRVVALRSGPLLRSVEASIALPGIARPVSIGSSTYIDGGLRGPIPSAQARTMGADYVIRVELIGGHPLRASARRRYRSAIMGALTRRRLLPTASDDVNLGADFANGDRAMEAPADLTIAPEFYGLFCNSPLGVRFCARQGAKAAGKALVSFPPPTASHLSGTPEVEIVVR